MQSDFCSWFDWRSGLHQQVPPSAGWRGSTGVCRASVVSHGIQLFVSGAAECSGWGINQVLLLKRQRCRCDSEASNVLQISRSQARWRSKYNSFPCQQLFHSSFVHPSLLRRARLTRDKLPHVLAFRHEYGDVLACRGLLLSLICSYIGFLKRKRTEKEEEEEKKERERWSLCRWRLFNQLKLPFYSYHLFF